MKRSALLILTALCAAAQTEPRQQFEVASVKPSAPGGRGMFIRSQPGGRLNITNMTLKEMIVFAWRIHPFQVSGGPPWLDSIRYEVVAKAETDPKPGQLPVMLQALLEDRFQLKIRRETKELPVYALVLAKKDGKLGPKLTEPQEGSCVPFDPTKPPPPPSPTGPRGCGSMRMGPSQLNGVSVELPLLLPPLSRMLGRTVIDKTGLTGKYDIQLEWTPDDAQLMQLPPDMPKPQFDANG